jgi:superfamily II DNA or RNA helicase
MLKNLPLQPVYDSAEYDIVRDFMSPCLAASTKYMRGVGFFSSGWLRLAATGIAALVENGGKALFVVSPILSEQDWESMQIGTSARDDRRLWRALERNISDLETSLQDDTRNTLAWLVADNVLDFLIAVRRDRVGEGDYHDKVGIFVDTEGNKVAFHGSFNDSVKGSLNGEAFSVFRSWDEGQRVYVGKHEERLRSLADNRNAQFEVFAIPDAAKESLIRLRTTSFRPYNLPGHANLVEHSPVFEKPQCPYTLHVYQELAISQWMKNGCRGLLEMATGTGKTITSLAAATGVFERQGRQALVILVPYLHLLDQWENELRRFGYDPLLCSSAHPRWFAKASSCMDDYKIGATMHACFLAVHATASSEPFQRLLARVDGRELLLVADEAHALGAQKLRNSLFEGAGMRLGLSATPRRWFDVQGTDALFSYFSGVVYEFPLEEAIGTYLTHYDYFPIPVELSSRETAEYQQLSAKIALVAKRADEDEREASRLEKLLLERARLIWRAENKLAALVQLVSRLKADTLASGGGLSHTLVYCAPGEHSTVLRQLSALGLRCHEFVHYVSLPNRMKVLEAFAAGDIDILVAVKCLDEGVDVPSTRTAIFMASTTNPREFVQRRGRVLRRYPGKTVATVYDLVVVPPQIGEAPYLWQARSIERTASAGYR